MMLHSAGLSEVQGPFKAALSIGKPSLQAFGEHGFELVSAAEPDLMANDPTRILVP